MIDAAGRHEVNLSRGLSFTSPYVFLEDPDWTGPQNCELCRRKKKGSVALPQEVAKSISSQILSFPRIFFFNFFSCGLLNLKLESYPPFLGRASPNKTLPLTAPPESAVPRLSTKNMVTSRLPWRWDATQDGRRAVGPGLAAWFFLT